MNTHDLMLTHVSNLERFEHSEASSTYYGELRLYDWEGNT